MIDLDVDDPTVPEDLTATFQDQSLRPFDVEFYNVGACDRLRSDELVSRMRPDGDRLLDERCTFGEKQTAPSTGCGPRGAGRSNDTLSGPRAHAVDGDRPSITPPYHTPG